MEKKTPLYEKHLKYKGKMVPFAGYLLPVQYEEGVIREHMAVRKACGVFDVSHMGEVTCRGEDALKNLNYLLTNNFEGMYHGQARYSPMCNEEGGVVDDMIVYKVKDNDYLLVVNAANKNKVYNWVKTHGQGNVVFEDISKEVAQIALQGPRAFSVISKVAKLDEIPKKYYSGIFNCTLEGAKCMISKTGYTGENGYEMYMEALEAPKIWEILLEAGKEEGLIPCGLGARDTLRLEAGMPLYGHEMNDEITPIEAGLGMFVKMDKEDFIGKKSLEQKEPAQKKRIGLKVTGRGIIRENMEVYSGDCKIGITTSGTYCPYIGYPAAMAMLPSDYSKPGTKVTVIAKRKKVEAEVVELPFYKKSK
ncbi:glycine cleavage system aminomethyltransferase GcvT [Clostridium sp. BJN0013]|uniref:glycine cleavage system aminomethyltransferase GcvT n=1 Tax=Clostridium sp. BJN0013 TaxID=3236840 RepID=UPI0034C5DAD0